MELSHHLYHNSRYGTRHSLQLQTIPTPAIDQTKVLEEGWSYYSLYFFSSDQIENHAACHCTLSAPRVVHLEANRWVPLSQLCTVFMARLLRITETSESAKGRQTAATYSI